MTRGNAAAVNKDATGVPATLNKVVMSHGRPLLEPFPSYEANGIGNCNGHQNVGAMRIDRATGLLWVADLGTVNRFPVCPAKIAIFDPKSGDVVREHFFHQAVFNPLTGYIIDMAFAMDHGESRYAFMADATDYKLIVYDFLKDKSWFFKDKSMQFDTCGSRLVSGDAAYHSFGGLRSLAVSPDSRFLYFSAIAAYNVYQIPVEVLLKPGTECSKHIRTIGETPLSMVFIGGTDKIYLADYARNSLKAWNRQKDLERCRDESEIKMESFESIVRSEEALLHVFDIALDNGYLYYLSNNLRAQRFGTIDFTDVCQANFIIGRVL